MKSLLCKLVAYLIITSGMYACGSDGSTDSKVPGTTTNDKGISISTTTAENAVTGRLKLSVTGHLPPALVIGGISANLELPAGVTVDTVPFNGQRSPLLAAPGVFTLEGTSASSSLSVVAFAPATSSSPAMVKFAIINSGSIGIGEFASLNYTILPGNPAPTVADFALRETEIVGTNSSFTVESLAPWVKVALSIN